jgi:hypothetical protein
MPCIPPPGYYAAARVLSRVKPVPRYTVRYAEADTERERWDTLSREDAVTWPH